MSSQLPSDAWVAAAVAALNRHGSWTGRIHVHKLLYLTKSLGLADPPFNYTLYQYGPYSYDLDTEIAQMELYGLLYKCFPKPGYGPKYLVSDLGVEEAGRLHAKDSTAIEQVARAIGKNDGQSLELQATCLWVQNTEGIQNDDMLVDRVRTLKPKYGADRIRDELVAARALQTALSR